MSEPLPTSAPEWNFAHRLVFRFVALYFALYLYYVLLNYNGFDAAANVFWNAIVPWVGKHVLHVSKDLNAGSGGGDTASDYTRIFCCVMFAALGTLLWTLIDRKRTHYRRLHDWLRVFVRYSLALIMLNYGASKIFEAQFPFPGLATMMSTFGDSSGQLLLWTFMGYSRPYAFFGGAAEAVGAVLLFSRRTTTLGALILSAVLANVVMLNFSYDVNIKQFSSHLLLMSIFLLTPDLRGLVNFLVLNRPASPTEIRAPFSVPWMRMGRLGVKCLFVGSAIFFAAKAGWDRQKGAAKPPLYGIWQVEEFVRNGQSTPPLTTDSTCWRQAIFGGNDKRTYSGLYVKQMNDSVQYYTEEFDQANRTVTIFPNGNKRQRSVLSYIQSDPDHLRLEGTIGIEPLMIKLKRVDESRLRLVQREFRLVR